MDFLHRQGLTHRDIKPSNIIFVNGQPKLADVGLTAEIPPPGKDYSQVGTLSYMPAPPEPHGTPQADIYSLGMVLYVISTGQKPGPGAVCDMPTSLAGKPEFMRLNAVILKACQPDCAQRYASAAEMHAALLKVQKTLEAGAQTQRL
jgi:serine/threonine protein kinase